MSKSYRIRTTPGVDKSLNVLIDQEFDYLEILSLKLLQSEIYTRQCSDYGVIVGRVSVNNGFGIPNAKVSVFIPLDSQDELDPVISDLYPYKTLNDINEDGYRYNLLPYTQSHTGHNPTGTFFDREDVLTNPTLIEVFDKYYKYTATTNESGDYMIFGIPTGNQTIVMDVDLSDIGEFSLSPQDLVRMGVATEDQVSGTDFKSSTNLRELPQIININKTVEVEPLWGQPEICNLGITRLDFDLSGEASIEISPTAIFMGSIISAPNSHPVRRNCKPKNRGGYLCGLTVNSGEILAIRQTIFQDENGRPILETFELEQGGQVIDENGTWLIDVPMNLDYITTNEFGEQVISDNPEVGIPTNAKYRFKVKWGQSSSLSESIKRGYFLVPNIKEHGWTNSNTDPFKQPIGTEQRTLVDKSYAFSLNWSDYGVIGTTVGDHMIQEAIDCQDKFYFMSYNKVYTVSQFIDSFREGSGLERYVGIKNILDNECESDNYRFPTNDGNLRFDILYIIFTFFSVILTPIFFAITIILHLFYFLIELFRIILFPLLIVYFGLLAVNSFIGAVSTGFGVTFSFGVFAMGFVFLALVALTVLILTQLWKMRLRGISIPLLTYPDCELCTCSQGDTPEGSDDVSEAASEVDALETERIPCDYIVSDENPSNGILLLPSISKLSILGTFKYEIPSNLDGGINTQIKNGFIRQLVGFEDEFNGEDVYSIGAPKPYKIQYSDDDDTLIRYTHTLSLPIADRINLFNTKAKYFNETGQNPGGGVNRIKVRFNPIIESSKFHYDNTIVLLCDKTNLSKLSSGQMISFQNPSFSKDINLSGSDLNVFGNNAITGDVKTNIITNLDSTNQITDYIIPSISTEYANPNGNGNLNVTYTNVTQTVDTNNVINFNKFPTDIEYYQVITGMTYDNFNDISVTLLNNSLNQRYITNDCRLYYTTNDRFQGNFRGYIYRPDEVGGTIDVPTIENVRNYNELCVVILNRGVDPYSIPTTIEYGLGRLFGFNNEESITIRGNYRLNIPIQGSFKNTSHKSTNYNSTKNVETDSYTNNKLYHDSFIYQPDINKYSGFTSNLLSFYSSLDNTSTGFKPICGDPEPPSVSNFASSNNIIGLNVRSSNPFTKERESSSIPSNRRLYNQTINNDINNGRNRGYFLNEIVEGSNLIGIEFNNSNLMKSKSFYYSPIYDTTGNTFNFELGSSGNQIVMRGDRLPTSTTLPDYCCNTFHLQKNQNLIMYLIPNTGVIGAESTSGGVLSAGSDEYNDFREETENIGRINSIIQSFNCEDSAPLDCYDGDSGNMIVKGTNDECRKFRGNFIFKNGCYKLVTKIFTSLPKDLELVAEWNSRNMISLGACRNVFSHRFNNNWINGTLYAFPFNNDVIFTSPTSSNPNQPISRYCNRNVILHPTNNFYYRSSPYYYDEISKENSKFIKGDGIKYPTTIMDLGPRNYFLQELVFSDDYDGYVINNLDSSTYGDVIDILNLFIISRLINQSFLKNILGSLNILGYFSRFKRSFDGDYSQLISINSELGVTPFQSVNYPDNPSGYQNPIYFNDARNNKVVIGIFFLSNMQTRDYISPKRQILNPFTNSVDDCSFNNINVFSQEVPMYQWDIKESSDAGLTIFGYQENNWQKEELSNGIFSFKYQDLDRLNPESRYFRTNGSSETYFDKGYIYSVSGNTPGLDIDESINNWDRNTDQPNWITVGAPFHFYFGLRRGASAFDRFRQKWINTEIIIN